MVFIDRFVFLPYKTPCPSEKANMYVPRSTLYPKDKTSIPCYFAEPENVVEGDGEEVEKEQEQQQQQQQEQEEENSTKTVILYSHGNSEDLRNVQGFSRFLSTSLGIPVLAYEYPGYGLNTRKGKPSEKKLYRDAECCIAYLTREMGFRPERIIVMGFSLGSGPTTYLASLLSAKAQPRLGFPKPGLLGGCIIMSGLASCIRTVSRTLAVLFPYVDMFRNIAKISKVSVPTLILHGEADPVVPFWHSVALWEKLQPAARWRRLAFPGGTHTNILSAYYAEAIASLREFVAFVSDRAQGASASSASSSEACAGVTVMEEKSDPLPPSPLVVYTAESPLLEKGDGGNDSVVDNNDENNDDDGSVPKP